MRVQTFKLSNFQTFKLSNSRTHHFSHKLRNIYKKKPLLSDKKITILKIPNYGFTKSHSIKESLKIMKLMRRFSSLPNTRCEFTLPNFQTFELSNFRTFKLSNFQTFKLSNFQTFKLSNSSFFSQIAKYLQKKTVSQIKCKKKLSFTTEYTKFATHKKNYGT